MNRYLITTSKDMTCRIFTVDRTITDFVSSTLSGHRDYIINAWFSADMKNVSNELELIRGLRKSEVGKTHIVFCIDLFY